MEQAQLKLTKELISRDFEVAQTDEDILTEEELLRVLSNRVAYMIEHQIELLLSLMYRLDVAESKVQMALSPLSSEAPNVAIAKLVIERQKQRAFTKLNYKPEDLGDGWTW
ncbi:MAG: hypothetical protein Sapg2KO_39180 [Saprospiraceae bacterium]